MYAAGYKLRALKNRSYALKHMISGGADILRNLIFKRLYTDCVHISCACDEVKLVGVLAGKLVCYEVAAVVKIFAFYEIIVAYGVPAGRSDHSDGLALFRRHEVAAYICEGRTAAPETVKVTEAFP